MRRQFSIKRTREGRALLNHACGIYMHRDWNNIDFNPYTRMVRYRRLAALLKAVGILSAKRTNVYGITDRAIIAWDLRNGIPFPDQVF